MYPTPLTQHPAGAAQGLLDLHPSPPGLPQPAPILPGLPDTHPSPPGPPTVPIPTWALPDAYPSLPGPPAGTLPAWAPLTGTRGSQSRPGQVHTCRGIEVAGAFHGRSATPAAGRGPGSFGGSRSPSALPAVGPHPLDARPSACTRTHIDGSCAHVYCCMLMCTPTHLDTCAHERAHLCTHACRHTLCSYRLTAKPLTAPQPSPMCGCEPLWPPVASTCGVHTSPPPCLHPGRCLPASSWIHPHTLHSPPPCSPISQPTHTRRP